MQPVARCWIWTTPTKACRQRYGQLASRAAGWTRPCTGLQRTGRRPAQPNGSWPPGTRRMWMAIRACRTPTSTHPTSIATLRQIKSTFNPCKRRVLVSRSIKTHRKTTRSCSATSRTGDRTLKRQIIRRWTTKSTSSARLCILDSCICRLTVRLFSIWRKTTSRTTCSPDFKKGKTWSRNSCNDMIDTCLPSFLLQITPHRTNYNNKQHSQHLIVQLSKSTSK